jgi:ABC-type sugar transport system ATPase subunit
VHAGEILGIGGLQGAGRSELLRLLAGAQWPKSGSIEYQGSTGVRSSRAAVARGIGYLPEGRARLVLPGLDVMSNVTIASLRRYNRLGILRRSSEREAFERVSRDVHLVGDPKAPIGSLSGGNQQKVGLARWLLRDVKLLILDEPTAGIDVHARAEIHRLIREVASRRTSVIVACAEPEELVLLCSRVLVLAEGRLVGELTAPFDEDEVVSASYRLSRAS